MTGKTTTRNRSTRPAVKSERHSVRLPMVRIGAARLLQLADRLDGVAGDEPCVRPRKWLLQGAREDDLREAGEHIVPGSPSVASPDISR